jgi:hypothetical protein
MYAIFRPTKEGDKRLLNEKGEPMEFANKKLAIEYLLAHGFIYTEVCGIKIEEVQKT